MFIIVFPFKLFNRLDKGWEFLFTITVSYYRNLGKVRDWAGVTGYTFVTFFFFTKLQGSDIKYISLITPNHCLSYPSFYVLRTTFSAGENCQLSLSVASQSKILRLFRKFYVILRLFRKLYVGYRRKEIWVCVLHLKGLRHTFCWKAPLMNFVIQRAF